MCRPLERPEGVLKHLLGEGLPRGLGEGRGQQPLLRPRPGPAWLSAGQPARLEGSARGLSRPGPGSSEDAFSPRLTALSSERKCYLEGRVKDSFERRGRKLIKLNQASPLCGTHVSDTSCLLVFLF